MTGPEHYLAAERLAEQAARYTVGDFSGDPLSVAQGTAMLVEAQVHATLALAAATALAIDPSPEAVAAWDPLLLADEPDDEPEPQCGDALAPGIHCIRTEFEEDGRHPGDGFHEDGRGNRWAP